MNVSYEDEMPNFAGWAVFDGPNFWDEGIIDEEIIRQVVSKYSPDTNLDDEDEYHEALWESIYDWQRENFNRVEKEIINSRDFEVD